MNSNRTARFTRKICPILAGLFLGALLAGCGGKAGFPKLRGPYLGQALPGAEPALFAPGVVSTGFYERDLAVSPDGTEIFYGLVFGKHVTIMHTRLVNGAWTEPEIAPFARDLSCFYFEPALSSDGNRLYFLCTRAPAGQEPKRGWAYQNIWAVDRADERLVGRAVHRRPPRQHGRRGVFPLGHSRRDDLFHAPDAGSGGGQHLSCAARETARMPRPRCSRTRSTARGASSTRASPPTRAFSSRAWGGRDDSITKGLPHYYVFFRNPDDTWSEGINLGEKINFPGAQALSPSISSDGKYFFFATTKAEDLDANAPGALTARGIREYYGKAGNGLADIYWIDASYIRNLKK